ncbi:MAG: hypothetical protein WBD40_10910 [Tepidisphaeraceae bacterium]
MSGHRRRRPIAVDLPVPGLSRRELLAVCGIILVLSAILVPVVWKVQEAAKKAAAHQRPAPTTVIQHPPVDF